jgi:nucleoside-diphosphate-sugar epimerase
VITLFGASGFIGFHLAEHLERSGEEYQAVGRGDAVPRGPLGHIIYCIGVTGDFRERPYDAVDAHVCALLDLVRHASFDTLLYVSSTRLYAGRSGTAREDEDLAVNPLRFEDIYNLSKATGEAITLSLGAKGRVARPSNVYGARQANSFLASVVDEARTSGSITFRTTPESARDYVSVRDVAELLVAIALRGRERIYNLASGVNVTNAELAGILARETGCGVHYAPDAAPASAPAIDISRVRDEFGFRPASLADDLPPLLGGRI